MLLLIFLRVADALLFDHFIVVEVGRFGQLGEQGVPVFAQTYGPEEALEGVERDVGHVAGFKFVEGGLAYGGRYGYFFLRQLHAQPVVAIPHAEVPDYVGGG